MAMTTLGSAEVAQFNPATVAGGQVWTQYPISLDSDETKAYLSSDACALISGSAKEPSKMARIDRPLAAVTHQVDALYRKSHLDCRNGFVDATKNDAEIAKKGVAPVEYSVAASEGYWTFGIGAAAREIYRLLLIDVGVINPQACLRPSYRNKVKLNRLGWLKEVSVREKDRLEDTKNRLTSRASGLASDITDLKSSDEKDLGKEAELREIAAVYRALFGVDLLFNGSQTVEQFLN